MRYFLILWFAPLLLFWGWFALSANDLNFGSIYLSRQLHDIVMAVYAKTLGVEADTIPQMIASATIIDSALVGAIAAFRWRSRWWPRFRGMIEKQFSRDRQPDMTRGAPSDPVHPEG
jgi:Family of unknown function (DUF6105)